MQRLEYYWKETAIRNMSSLDDKFKEEYKDYEYPLKSLKQKLKKMTQIQREKYFKHASKIKDDPVHLEIMNEISRDLIKKLSDEEDKPKRNLYKGTLLFLNEYRSWIDDLARLNPKNREGEDEALVLELEQFFDN